MLTSHECPLPEQNEFLQSPVGIVISTPPLFLCRFSFIFEVTSDSKALCWLFVCNLYWFETMRKI